MKKERFKMSKKVPLNYSSSSKEAVQIVDADWEEPTEPVDFGKDVIQLSDFVGHIREVKDLPHGAELNNRTEIWQYSPTQMKLVRRRKSHFNIGTRVGKLEITHIVEMYPSYGQVDYSNIEAMEYKCRSYVCQCKPEFGGCGKVGIVRPYHYLFQRGERASCGSPKCMVPRGNNHNDQYKGQTFRRLLVQEWVSGKGWKCECQMCGEEEWVRYSWQLERAGSPKKCSNYALVQEGPVKKKERLTKSKLARMDGRTL